MMSGSVAAIPLTRKVVIFSFCQVGRSSQTATAIFVSNVTRSAVMLSPITLIQAPVR